MNRASRVCVWLWLFVGEEEIAFRMGICVTALVVSVLTTLTASVAYDFCVGKRSWSKAMMTNTLIVVVAVIYGMWFQAFAPSRPSAAPGAITSLIGTVQSVTVKNGKPELLVRVGEQGASRAKCGYYALILPNGNGVSNVEAGQRVEASGIFLDPSASSASALDRLAPLWLFQGSVVPVETHSPFRLAAIRDAMAQTVGSNRQTDVDLALSMVLGRASTLPQPIQQIFLTGGVTHLLAASGGNVALLLRFVSPLLQPLRRVPWRIAQWLETIVLHAAVWAFVIACGSTIPIVRAGLLTSYVLLSRATRRRVDAWVALTASCFLFALVRPMDVLEPSGILSLVATFAVFEASVAMRVTRHCGKGRDASGSRWGRVAEILSRVCRHSVELVLMSLFVDAYMLPIVWWMFGQITPYGALSTVMMEPLVAILLPMTLVWAACSWSTLAVSNTVVESLSHALGWTVTGGLQVALGLLQHVSALKNSMITLPNLPFPCALTLFLAMVMWRRIRRPIRFSQVNLNESRVKRPTL